MITIKVNFKEDTQPEDPPTYQVTSAIYRIGHQSTTIRIEDLLKGVSIQTLRSIEIITYEKL